MVVVSTKNVKRAIANARGIKDIGSPQVCESMEKLNMAMIMERHLATIAPSLTNTYLKKITTRHMSINGCLNHGVTFPATAVAVMSALKGFKQRFCGEQI